MRRSEMAARLGRSKSTVSRELARDSSRGCYRASTAQKKHEARRKRCVRPRKLDDPATFELVSDKLLGGQWSPEQIEMRLKIEGPEVSVSDAAVYRAVRAGEFDKCVPKRAKASRKLRHKRKRRGSKGCSEERRGRSEVPARIDQRPSAADERSETGHRESDAVEGTPGGACHRHQRRREERVCHRRQGREEGRGGSRGRHEGAPRRARRQEPRA